MPPQANHKKTGIIQAIFNKCHVNEDNDDNYDNGDNDDNEANDDNEDIDDNDDTDDNDDNDDNGDNVGNEDNDINDDNDDIREIDDNDDNGDNDGNEYNVDNEDINKNEDNEDDDDNFDNNDNEDNDDTELTMLTTVDLKPEAAVRALSYQCQSGVRCRACYMRGPSWSSSKWFLGFQMFLAVQELTLNWFLFPGCWLIVRRSKTGFGILDLPQKSTTKAKFRPLGLNRDFFGTIFGPLWDF